MTTTVEDFPLYYEDEPDKAMPSLNHSWINANLIAEYVPQRDFRVHGELTLQVGSRPRTPDISVYRRGKPLDMHHDVARASVPPLVAVEIFSPHQPTQAVMDKIKPYFAHGIKSVWIVAPPVHSISIYCSDGRTVHQSSGVIEDPMVGLKADVDAVFAP